MEQRIYVIYDEVAKESGELMILKNDNVARRIMQNALEKIKDWDKDSYNLYCLGKYDKEKMLLLDYEVPQKIDLRIPDIREEENV